MKTIRSHKLQLHLTNAPPEQIGQWGRMTGQSEAGNGLSMELFGVGEDLHGLIPFSPPRTTPSLFGSILGSSQYLGRAVGGQEACREISKNKS